MTQDLDRRLRDLVRADVRYPYEAYRFVFEALEHTVRLLGERRHVSGRELLDGARTLALDQFGGLARMVLENWNIRKTDDFGEIVFRLVEAGLMGKTDTDRKEDFHDVFDFDEAFPRTYAPQRKEPKA